MDDYISLEAANEVCRECVRKYPNSFYNGIEAVRSELRNIPAADVRPVVRGKWEPDYDYAEYDFDGSTPLIEPRKFQDGWKCSSCGGYTPSETSFCPNCGADMREE